jgi:hypothetical protein
MKVHTNCPATVLSISIFSQPSKKRKNIKRWFMFTFEIIIRLSSSHGHASKINRLPQSILSCAVISYDMDSLEMGSLLGPNSAGRGLQPSTDV